MLDAETNTYPPVNSSAKLALISLLVSIICVAVYLGYGYARKRSAIKKQGQLLSKKLVNQDELIAEAIAKLNLIVPKVQAGQISEPSAAYEASQITRQYFDLLMNHSTSYASKAELYERYLQDLAAALDIAYPLEFDKTSRNISSIDQLQKMINVAIGVIKTCN